MLRKRTEPHPSALHATTVDDLLVVSGPRLDEVLEEVGARLGPDAEILDVRREIVGGVAGEHLGHRGPRRGGIEVAARGQLAEHRRPPPACGEGGVGSGRGFGHAAGRYAVGSLPVAASARGSRSSTSRSSGAGS